MRHFGTDRSRRHRRVKRVLFLTCATLVFASGLGLQRLRASDIPVLPPGIPAHRALDDSSLITLTLTKDWKKFRIETSLDAVTWSPALWIDMHFDDWDRLDPDIRRRGLTRMRHRYAHLVSGPATWAGMDASDWDVVPQPIRMVVFPLMVQHWIDTYAPGAPFGLSRRLMTDTVSAILMAESWFQHRAWVVNPWGNADIGLGQCSDRCRRELGRIADAGLLDFALTDEDYLHPWHATRAAVVWFGLELARATGDVDLAIRAYHRGFEAACAGEGGDYLKNVRRLRGKYFDAPPDESPTWQGLKAWARAGASRDDDGVFPADGQRGTVAAAHAGESVWSGR